MFDSTRRLFAGPTSVKARLHTLVDQAGTHRPDDELPADQPWTEGSGDPPEATPPPPRRHLPGVSTVGRRWLVVGLAAVLLLAVGIGIAVASGGPVPEPVTGLPPAADVPTVASVTSVAASPATTAKIVVSVRGKVARPGLITLARGARVADAIEACGGLRRGAETGPLNLARKLSDGEQIYVAIPVPAGAAGPGASTPDTGAASQSKVDLNTATAAQLDTLPGVGEVTAQRIVRWREQHGRFATVDQLQQVPGIGDAKLATLRDLVVAG